MSCITKEEFEAVLKTAQEASWFKPSAVRDAVLIRAFFAALPADVKLMRREATPEMYGAGFGATAMMSFIPMSAVFRTMFDAAPASLPEES